MRPILFFGILESIFGIEAPREYLKFDAVFADVCPTNATCSENAEHLRTGII